MKLNRQVSIPMLVLLAGCTSAPVARKTAPLPPSPPGMTNVVKRQSVRPSALTLTPAAAVVPAERPVYIVPYGPGYFGVIGVQMNSPGGTLEFVRSPLLEAPLSTWASMSTPFWVAQGETMMVQIPHWIDQNFFVDVKSVQGPRPTFTPAAAGTDTGKTLTVRGKKYKLILISPAGAQFPMYRLQL